MSTFEFILLIILSVIVARLLDKRYRVAAVAHAVLFIFMLFVFMLTTDLSFIRQMMINWMGKTLYYNIYSSIVVPVAIFNFALSGLMAIEFAIFIFIPLLSIALIIKEIREKFGKLDFKMYPISFANCFSNNRESNSELVLNSQNTYLILQRILN